MTTAVISREPHVLVDLLPRSLLRDAAVIAAGAALTGAAAQVSIHSGLTPVPFTLQTFSVLLTGAALGPWRGFLSMLVYLAAGSAGVPWFAHHAHGWAADPSFGYIIGFLLAAAFVGTLARQGHDRNIVSTVGLLALGDALLLTVGTCWLAIDLHVSASQAVSLGVTPFLVGDAVKIGVAALALPTAWRLVRR